MAARKKAKEINNKPVKDLTVPEKKDSGLALAYQPVSLVDTAIALPNIEGLPSEWETGETLAGFPPSPEWRTPGQAIFGEFIGVKINVGPNNSRLYEIAAYQGDGKPFLTVALWGSAAIDRLFDSAYPPVQTGDKIGFIYLGEKESKRGLNPLKLFTMKLLRPKK